MSDSKKSSKSGLENLADGIKAQRGDVKNLKIGALSYIRLKNFKQFLGIRKIGPFLNFTSIVGANGAGKSTVMEAIAFGLGVQERRYSDQNIEKIRNYVADQDSSVFVEMVFNSKNDSTIILKREFQGTKGSVFTVNGDEFSKVEYRNFVKESKLNPFESSFWLNQNLVDELCVKNGSELMDFFEKTSGSHEYKKEFDEKKHELLKIEQEKKEISDDIRRLKRQLNLSKKHISNGDVYHKLGNEFDELAVDRTLAQLLECDVRKYRSELRLKEIKSLLDNKEQFSDRLTKDLREKMSQNEIGEDTTQLKRELEKSSAEIGKIHERKYQKEQKREETLATIQAYEKSKMFMQGRFDECQNLKKEYERAIQNSRETLSMINQLTNIPDKYKKAVKEFTSKSKGREDFEEARISRDIHDLEGRRRKKIEEIDTTKNEVTQIQNQLTIKNLNIISKTKELEAMEKRQGDLENRKHDLEKKCVDLEVKQQDLRAKKNELTTLDILMQRLSDKIGFNQKQTELMHHLSTNVSGFKGRFGNLIKPLDSRFNLATRILLGKAADYFVVDNVRSAELVNDILKEKFIQKSVIILESLPEISKSRLSEFRTKVAGYGSAAFDIVYYEPENSFIEPAIRFFMNNKVCCETLRKANKLREILGKKANIVTVDGVQLKGNVLSSVGSQGKFFEDKKSRGEIEGRLKELQRRKEQIESEIENLLSEEEEEIVNGISTTIREYELMSQRLKTVIEMLQEEKGKLEVSHSRCLERIKLLEDEVLSLEETVEPLRLKHAQMNKERLVREEELLREFLKGKKVSSKDFEGLVEKTLEVLDKTIESNFIFNERIQHLGRKAADLDLSGKAKQLEEIEAKIEEISEQKRKLDDEVVSSVREIKSMRKEILKKKGKIEEIEKSRLKKLEDESELRVAIRELSDEIDNLRAEGRNLRTEIQRSETNKDQIIEERTVEGIDIPRNPDKTIDYYTIEKRVRESRDGMVIEEAEGMLETDELVTFLSRESAISIKNILNERYQKASREINKHCSKFFSSEFIDKEKSNEVFLREKIKDLQASIRESFSNEGTLKTSLEKLKSLRNERFITLYTKVSLRIKEMYQQLCGSRAAHASLFLENETDPCSGKIKYITTPPNKKHIFDPQALSGGERALASLALFFSINDALNSPFVMLDEADSPFDPTNSSLYGICLKKYSAKRQCVLISHTHNIYRRSDMLLGIVMNSDDQSEHKSSKCISFKISG